ncbi:MAG: DNA-3-methyladenine glycosylase [Actinomycetota bacterium]|nr:DNA-3-methyladenine glycosylase [Actinomycetota bacterium]
MRDLDDLLAGPVLEVAPRLLGAVLRKDEVAVRITEVEAYDGPNDPGSHAYRGPTERNRVMFGPPGRLYVYFTYGMHFCANLVVGPEGSASAVLLRAGEVVDGVETAAARRRSSFRDLARGPARLCQALDLGRLDNGSVPELTLPPSLARSVRCGPRVGLREAADRPWRFWVEGEPSVSPYRPAAPLRVRKSG